MDDLGGERYATVTEALQRNGTVAVIVQRLAPGIPDAPFSYAAGVVGIGVGQIATIPSGDVGSSRVEPSAV